VREVAEMALARAIPDAVEAAYRSGSALCSSRIPASIGDIVTWPLWASISH
jgi:hypothetical protein